MNKTNPYTWHGKEGNKGVRGEREGTGRETKGQGEKRVPGREGKEGVRDEEGQGEKGREGRGQEVEGNARMSPSFPF